MIRNYLLITLFAMLSSVLCKGAEHDHPGFVNDGFDYSEEYFAANFSYTYEEDGQMVTVPITTPARSEAAIVALLTEIYTNPHIPGRKWIHGDDYVKYRVADMTLGRQGATQAETDAYQAAMLEQFAEAFPGIDPYRDYTPDCDGLTALLCEGVDDDRDDDYEGIGLDRLKCVTLITSRVILDDNTLNDGVTPNPGYLFAINKQLHKFFFITKGKARQMDRWGCSLPLFTLFEEFSPNDGSADEEPKNVFKSLWQGNRFEVNHDCSSVMFNIGHYMVVKSMETGAPMDLNLSFFIPYYRSYDDVHDPEHAYVDGDWPEAYTWYHPRHMPFVYRYTVMAEAESAPVPVEMQDVYDPDEKYMVTISWHTAFRDFFQTARRGEYQVFRVVDGIIQDEPICFVGTNDGAVTTVSGEYVYSNTETNVSAYYFEDRKYEGRHVSYVVGGRLEGLDKPQTYSNIAKAYIPGRDSSEGFVLDLLGYERSVFVPSTHYNEYTHALNLLNPLTPYAIRGGDVDAGGVFELYRIALDDDGNELSKSRIATLTVDRVSASQHPTKYLALKLKYDNEAEARPGDYRWIAHDDVDGYALRYDPRDIDGVAEVPDPANTELLCRFDDYLRETIPADNSHPRIYRYHLRYTPPAALAAEREVKYSNKESMHIYKASIAVAPRSYSLAEITADTAHTLDGTGYDAIVNVANYPLVEAYRVRIAQADPDDKQASVLAVIQHTEGRFTTSIMRDGVLMPYGSTVYAEQGASTNIAIPIPAEYLAADIDYVVDICVTPYEKERTDYNYFGTPQLRPGAMPSMSITSIQLNKTASGQDVNRQTQKQIQVSVDGVLPSTWQVDGVHYYRVWRSVDGSATGEECILDFDRADEFRDGWESLTFRDHGDVPRSIIEHCDAFLDSSTGRTRATYFARAYISFSAKSRGKRAPAHGGATQRYMLAQVPEPVTVEVTDNIVSAVGDVAVEAAVITIDGDILSANAAVEICDINGRRVATMPAGRSSIARLAPGVYIARAGEAVLKFAR